MKGKVKQRLLLAPFGTWLLSLTNGALVFGNWVTVAQNIFASAVPRGCLV